MFAAHERLNEIRPLGESHPHFHSALTHAMSADQAYFSHFPGHHSQREDDQQWVAVDAATSKIEGFTAGDESEE